MAGGDLNHVAIIRLDSTEARLPEFGSFPSRNPPSVKIEQLGGDIINSISIHKLDGNADAGIAGDVVAVLTNNDKTVRIFSLTQHTQNTVLDLPFAVNHATISPGGRALVAVGDYQQAYFYERLDLSPSPDFKSHKYASAHCTWELLNIVILHVPKPAVVAGYFTSAWSPSGRLCAVSSELGYVSVLDIEQLRTEDDAEEATIAIVPSTRPDTAMGPGGIRTTAFSPQPWDLFAWSEDQGRVCLADLRSGLCIRQVLYLDPEQEGLRHVEVEDHPTNPFSRGLDASLEAEFMRQYHRSHTTTDDADILEAADTYLTAERRRVARAALRLHEDDDLFPSLTAQERQVLDALSIARQREDSLSRSPAPRSIYYGPSELSGESRRSTAQQASLFTQDFPGLARNSESSSSTGASTVALPIGVSEYMRNRNNPDSADRGSPIYSPRRQASIFIANNEADTAVSRLGPLRPPILNLAQPAQRRTSDWARPPSDRATLSPIDSTRSRHPSPPPSGDSNPEVIERRRRAIIRARERAMSMRASEREERHQISLSNRAYSRGDIYDRSLGLRTAGLAVSWDGRKIWAACDKGIFEYEVNVRGRMVFPAIEMR